MCPDHHRQAGGESQDEDPDRVAIGQPRAEAPRYGPGRDQSQGRRPGVQSSAGSTTSHQIQPRANVATATWRKALACSHSQS